MAETYSPSVRLRRIDFSISSEMRRIEELVLSQHERFAVRKRFRKAHTHPRIARSVRELERFERGRLCGTQCFAKQRGQFQITQPLAHARNTVQPVI